MTAGILPQDIEVGDLIYLKGSQYPHFWAQKKRGDYSRLSRTTVDGKGWFLVMGQWQTEVVVKEVYSIEHGYWMTIFDTEINDGTHEVLTLVKGKETNDDEDDA